MALNSPRKVSLFFYIIVAFFFGCVVAIAGEALLAGTTPDWSLGSFGEKAPWMIVALLFFGGFWRLRIRQKAQGVSKTLLLALAILFSACEVKPIVPKPGIQAAQAEQKELAVVRDGVVNPANGNFTMEFSDLWFTTSAGTQTIKRVFNSATMAWRFSFEMTYANGTFTDASGAVYSIGSLANDQPIAGTSYVKVNSTTIKTHGGLNYVFAPAGHLVSYRFAQDAWWTETRLSGGRISQLMECTTGSSCASIVSITRDASGNITRSYSAEGDLIRFTEAGVVARMLWGGAGTANAAGAPQSINLGFAKVSLVTAGKVHYYHEDHRGNVKMLVLLHLRKKQGSPR